MALRVSIGAGRARLMQLVLVESAMLALGASALGALVAWWAAPAVMSMIEPIEIPVRLVLDFDWRLASFGAVLAVLVTALFGFAPALRASSVTPVTALKGDDARQSRRMIKSLLVVQMTFCAFVLFAAGLFRATFDRLSSQSFGLSYDHVLALAVNARDDDGRTAHWLQLADAVRRLPGVDSAAVAGWPLLSRNGWQRTVRGGDRGADARPEYMLGVSPDFFRTLHIDLLEGRDFRSGDAGPRLDNANQPVAGVGIVNVAFAQRYFGGRNPVGERVLVRQAKDVDVPLDIIGLVSDTAYRTVRERMRPIVFVPYSGVGEGTLLVRVAGEPAAFGQTLARTLRREWAGARMRDMRPAKRLHRHADGRGAPAGATHGKLRDAGAAAGRHRPLRRGQRCRHPAAPRDRPAHGARRPGDGYRPPRDHRLARARLGRSARRPWRGCRVRAADRRAVVPGDADGSGGACFPARDPGDGLRDGLAAAGDSSDQDVIRLRR